MKLSGRVPDCQAKPEQARRMTDTSTIAPTHVIHGAAQLPHVEVRSYSLEARDGEGFVGDHANKGAFREILDNWRKVVRKHGDDPFGKESTEEISKKTLDTLLHEGDPEAAAIVHTAVEEFAQELARVITNFLKRKSWKDVERLVIGGGFREPRIGELTIGRASIILKSQEIDLEVRPIRHHPDAAGIIGVVQLAPSWMFKGFDAVLGVDIGGTNIRAGIVELNLKRASDLAKAEVIESELWRHADDEPKRDEAVARLVKMLEKLIAYADKKKLQVAPFIGIGCPGRIEDDGTIDRGVQNLPGNWASKGFHLPAALREAIPTIGEHETTVLLHNDAVVQGLSEVPFMQDVEQWGILTIGTGLGNASFVNRGKDSDSD
jgi:predicted NBD/HSP70 family sugar kinase